MALRGFPATNFFPDRENFIVELCRDKVVLDLGAADSIFCEHHIDEGRHLYINLHAIARMLYGVDLDEQAIQSLRDLGFQNLFVGNVEDLNINFGVEFELIIAGDIIEHLDNPGAFLDSVCRYMGENTLLILTTPNILSLKVFIHSIFGKQRIHGDHSVGFTFSLLQTLLDRHNLEVEQWMTTFEFVASRRAKLANKLLAPIFRILPRYGDTLVVIARKAQ